MGVVDLQTGHFRDEYAPRLDRELLSLDLNT